MTADLYISHNLAVPVPAQDSSTSVAQDVVLAIISDLARPVSNSANSGAISLSRSGLIQGLPTRIVLASDLSRKACIGTIAIEPSLLEILAFGE